MTEHEHGSGTSTGSIPLAMSDVYGGAAQKRATTHRPSTDTPPPVDNAGAQAHAGLRSQSGERSELCAPASFPLVMGGQGRDADDMLNAARGIFFYGPLFGLILWLVIGVTAWLYW